MTTLAIKIWVSIYISLKIISLFDTQNNRNETADIVFSHDRWGL